MRIISLIILMTICFNFLYKENFVNNYFREKANEETIKMVQENNYEIIFIGGSMTGAALGNKDIIYINNKKAIRITKKEFNLKYFDDVFKEIKKPKIVIIERKFILSKRSSSFIFKYWILEKLEIKGKVVKKEETDNGRLNRVYYGTEELNKFLKYCKDKNIKVLLLGEIKEKKDKEKIFNKKEKEFYKYKVINIDYVFEKDEFSYGEHLNKKGSEKFIKRIESYMKEEE